MASRESIDDVVAADLSADLKLPQMPPVDTSHPDHAAVEYSQHRTKLSTHRTALSGHRTEMSSRRTGMSFQRTRMSADRTLMSVIRTSLSLISFGFTIYQFFEHLVEKNLLAGRTDAARNFGAALVYLGVAMVAVGIVYHMQFMVGLRRERIEMTGHDLVHAQSRFPASFTLLVAILVLVLGVAVIASLTFKVGPFG